MNGGSQMLAHNCCHSLAAAGRAVVMVAYMLSPIAHACTHALMESMGRLGHSGGKRHCVSWQHSSQGFCGWQPPLAARQRLPQLLPEGGEATTPFMGPSGIYWVNLVPEPHWFAVRI